jgi:predicted alpha/beta superfamily hydrolase
MTPRLSIFAAAVALVSACGAPPPPTTGRIESLGRVASERVGVDYSVSVRLPPDYDASPDARYPVVYQLDAEFLGELALMTGHASSLEREGLVPSVIIVGVSRADDPGDPTTRTIDFAPPPLEAGSRSTGRADRFFAFLTEELGPRIDAAYRTDVTQRVLSGHSLGGLFALYAFLRDEPSPYFAHVIAADPSMGEDGGVIFGEESRRAAGSSSRPGSLLVTAARFTGAAQIALVSELVTRVEGRGYEGLRVRGSVLEADHGGAIGPSMRQGLLFSLGAAR